MTQPLAKISSMLESARDLTFEAAVSASSRFAETLPSVMGYQEVIKLLNSRNERDILSGMKCVMALISRGENSTSGADDNGTEDALRYFGDVVKNITCGNTMVKNLILIYLTKYAELEPDTALLSINTIQKSLNDKNPITRYTSIRAMAGIKISSISPITLLCIKRTVSDLHPDVRSATAIAIGKLYGLEDISSSTKKQLFEFLSKLLSDSNPIVVGSALKTFYLIKDSVLTSSVTQSLEKKKWNLLHALFRRLCRLLPTLEEWSQSFLIDILIEYSRLYLPKPKIYKENGEVSDYDQLSAQDHIDSYEVSMDADLQLFIDSLKPLIYTNSEFVILSISKALMSLAPPKTYQQMQLVPVTIRLISPTSNYQVAYFALQAIRSVVVQNRFIYEKYFKRFYIFPDDSPSIAQLKLEILSMLANESNMPSIFDELKSIVFNSNSILIAKQALVCIGRCSQISDTWNQRILKWCLKQITKTEGLILDELLTSIRYLVQTQNHTTANDSLAKTIYRLSLLITNSDTKIDSEAKASIIWIIGEFTNQTYNQIGPDVLRVLIPNFANEADIVRYQVLVLSAKIMAFELESIVGENEIKYFFEENIHAKMFSHILQLCKYDNSYDTRDRARMLSILLSGQHHESKLATLFLQVPKNAPLIGFRNGDVKNSDLANSFEIFQSYYKKIPDWADPSGHPAASVRKESSSQLNGGNENVVTSISSQHFVSKSQSPISISEHAISSKDFQLGIRKITPKETYRLQSLDEFFGNEDEEEESDEDDDDDDDDESEESESEESDEDEDDVYEQAEEDGIHDDANQNVSTSSESEDSDIENSTTNHLLRK